MKNILPIGITGVGYQLGETKVDNDEVSAMIKNALTDKKGSALTESEIKLYCTNDEWIGQRVGVKTRYITQGSTSELASKAVKKALENALIPASLVDGLIIASVTPDHIYSPPNASLVHGKVGLEVRNNLGLNNCFTCDVSNACTSFGSALTVGYSLIQSGICKCVVVVGADKMTSAADISNRSTFPIFGDAAAAFVLQPVPEQLDCFPHGILSFFAGTVPSGASNIMTPVGGSKQVLQANDLSLVEEHLNLSRPDKLTQNGGVVLKDIIRLIFGDGTQNFNDTVIGSATIRADVKLASIDLIIPHQANLRINSPMQDNLKPHGFKGLVYNTITEVGNTTSAAVPLGACLAYERGILQTGMNIILLHFGGGYTFQCTFIKWMLKEEIYAV